MMSVCTKCDSVYMVDRYTCSVDICNNSVSYIICV